MSRFPTRFALTGWVMCSVLLIPGVAQADTCVNEGDCLPTAQAAGAAAAGAAVAAALLALGHSAGTGSGSGGEEFHEGEELDAGGKNVEATGAGGGAGSGIELVADMLTDDILDLFVDLAKDTREDAENGDPGEVQPGA